MDIELIEIKQENLRKAMLNIFTNEKQADNIDPNGVYYSSKELIKEYKEINRWITHLQK